MISPEHKRDSPRTGAITFFNNRFKEFARSIADYRSSWTFALVIIGLPITLGVLTGWSQVEVSDFPGGASSGIVSGEGNPLDIPQDSIFTIFAGIWVLNIGTLVSLYSGILTFGFTSEFYGFLFAAFMGASLRANFESLGGSQLILNVWPYFLFEMAAFLVAGLAGVLPAARAIGGRKDPQNRTERFYWRYLHAIGPSLRLFAISVALLTFGAMVESIVISVR